MSESESEQKRENLPTSAEIIDAIRDAGWLLEQETANTLRENGYYVATGKAFPDPDEPTTSREVDAVAYREVYRNQELSFNIGVRIIAECKQSAMPYVAIGGPADGYESSRDRKEQVFRFERIEIGREDLEGGSYRLKQVTAREYLGLDMLDGNPWSSTFIGDQLTRMDRKKTWLAENRGIFPSLIYPLAKALTYYRSSESQFRGGNVHTPGRDWASIIFYYPIVVTSAPVFVVDASKSSVSAVRTPWVELSREIKSKKVDGKFNMYVVSSDNLDEFLEMQVERFASGIAELAESDPQRFITREDHSFVPSQEPKA